MSDPTTEEKLTIIRSWCHGFDISHDRCWAKINHSKQGNFEYTPTFNNYDNMINSGYNMLRERVWKYMVEHMGAG